MKLGLGNRRYVPFGYKLILTYVLVTSIPLGIIGVYAYNTTVHAVTERTQASLEGTLRQMKDNVEFKLTEAKRVSDQLYFDDNLQAIIRQSYPDVFDVYDTVENRLKPTLNYALKMSTMSLILALYTDNPQLPPINTYLDSQSLEHHLGSSFVVESMRNIQGWYDSASQPQYDAVWTQLDLDRKNGNWSLIRKVLDVKQGFQEIGLIRVIVGEKDLFQSLQSDKLASGTELYVVDRQGAELYNSGPATGNYNNEISDRAYSRSEIAIQELHCKVVALIPKATLKKDAIRVRNLTVVLCIASFLCMLLIGAIVSRYFSKRVNKISNSLEAFRQGEFRKRIHFGGNDEFAEIADSFNQMARTVNGLIEEVYVSNLQKKEYELEVLQAQINPHFLYNTLSSISRLAKLGETEKLHEMVLGLARFYRLTLNEGRLVIPVEMEIHQALTYLEIQSIKHGDRLKLYADIDEAAYEYETIKIILQPFLENVFKHAWFEGVLSIRLSVYVEDGDIHFKIIDNGVGMPQEKVEALLTSPESQGCGIRNVDQRLRLHYGEAYGVKIASGIGIGCTVWLRVPTSPPSKEHDNR